MSSGPADRSSMLAWGRLLRLSLTPTALADAAAGLLLGAACWPGGGAPWAMLGASFCAYHGGMALNDWADRARDGVARPERPIPSGAVGAGAALALAVLLLAAAPAIAWIAAPRAALLMGAVAATAALYDTVGRGAWTGPMLIAACRAGNLGAGLLAGAHLAGTEPAAVAFVPCAFYGAYVFLLGRLGRMEDAEDQAALGRRPAWILLLAAAALVAVGVFPHLELPALLLALFGAAPLVGVALTTRAWTRGLVLRCMGMGLRRLLIVTAALALRAGGSDGWIVAGAILAGYGLSWGLRRVFPPS